MAVVCNCILPSTTGQLCARCAAESARLNATATLGPPWQWTRSMTTDHTRGYTPDMFDAEAERMVASDNRLMREVTRRLRTADHAGREC